MWHCTWSNQMFLGIYLAKIECAGPSAEATWNGLTVNFSIFILNWESQWYWMYLKWNCYFLIKLPCALPLEFNVGIFVPLFIIQWKKLSSVIWNINWNVLESIKLLHSSSFGFVIPFRHLVYNVHVEWSYKNPILKQHDTSYYGQTQSGHFLPP